MTDEEYFASLENSGPGDPIRFAHAVAALRAGARLNLQQQQLTHLTMQITDSEGIDGAAKYLRGEILAHKHPWDNSLLPDWLTKDNWLDIFHEVAKETRGLY